MGDLISRKEVISRIESEYRQWEEDYDAEQILGDIEDMPTAFDLESAIAKFDEYKHQQSENEMLSDNGKWLVQRVIEECEKILKSATNATNQKECRENMKRQQAMKPKLNDMMLICPECGHNIKRCYWFCPECGQAISWGEDGGKDMNKLRKCKGKLKIYENGWHDMEFELGYFHGWGVNYEEFADVGVGNYSVAIVELPDGRIVMPMADDIVFLDKLESRIKKNERKE